MITSIQQLEGAAEGLAFEAELFSATEAAAGVWSAATQALVCPRAYNRREGFADAAEASARRGWPVHLRPTGGGVVPQGPGVVNLAVAFNAPKGFTIDDSYRHFVDMLAKGFGQFGPRLMPGETPGSFCDGDWNLSVDGKKLVGTAQRWRPVRGGRPRVLAHALILMGDMRAGAEAVDALHQDLGLGRIAVNVHTSTEAAFGVTAFPAEPMLDAARDALAAIHTPNP